MLFIFYNMDPTEPPATDIKQSVSDESKHGPLNKEDERAWIPRSCGKTEMMFKYYQHLKTLDATDK